MGRYIDWADVANRYPDVTKGYGAEALKVFVDDAEGEVDAALAMRYNVPFIPGSSNAPQMVRTLSAAVAYWYTIYASERGDKLRKYIDDRLAALATGSASLVTSGGIMTTNEILAWTDTAYRSSFGIDDPARWSVSSSWQESFDDARVGD